MPAPIKYKWSESTVDGILRNEKYVGDLLLQKTYVEDHLTKKKMINDGALPMYYVEDNHEPIISREDFNRVQAIRKARAAFFHPSTAAPVHYPFTSTIRCGQCGQHYRRAINSAGTKYAKTVWTCPTYDKQGKAACPSKKIPESILEAVTADALGLPAFDAEAFAVAVREVVVVEAGRLAYLLNDGRTVERTWEHASRAASWDDEARQRARDKALMNSRRRKES